MHLGVRKKAAQGRATLMKLSWIAGLGMLIGVGGGGAAAAQETVKIGAIYPLSGNAASAGASAKAALEVGWTSSTTRIRSWAS